MTAKEYLKAYQAEKLEADAIGRRIKDLERKKQSLEGVRYTWMPKHREQRDLSDPEASIGELTDKYIAKISSYISKEAEIIDRLEKMQDPEERTVIMLRYINSRDASGKPLTWYDIADQMNVSKRTAQYIHGRALQHFPMM